MEQTTVNRRYRVEQRIGEGGMAVVYRGRDLLLNRAVAIKALRPQYASDPTFRARFEREAQAAAGFTHPNIIDIYDVGEERGVPYIVMEYVRGETLKEIIAKEGPFVPEDVAALLEQVAAALDYAHDHGLVHRDVKPQNILVTPDGVAKVVDFGIAKGLADGDLTDVGAGLGTVHYISPEQASGLMATPASDVYSLAVVAFEMLTRALPFDADTPVGVAMRHVHDAPPRPSALNPSVPPQVDEIVLRGLAKDPTRRYPTAGRFAESMSGWANTSSPTQVTRLGPMVPPGRVSAPGSLNGTGAGLNSTRTAVIPPPRPAAGTTRGIPAPRPTAGRGGGLGCTTWLTGTLGLLLLIALVYGGFRFSPWIADLASSRQPTPTATAAGAGVGAVVPPTTAEPVPADAPSVPTTDPTPAEIVPIAPTIALMHPDAGTTSGLVTVPDLAGKTLDAATAMLTDRGLLMQDAGSVFSQTEPVNAIADQDPPAGQQVARGTTVAVHRSLGQGDVDIAALDLTGSDPDQATQTLQQLGINVQRDQVASDRVPAGMVAGVDPATATVGQTVTLHVSTGNDVQIPGALQGMPLDEAEAQLRALGLDVGTAVGVSRATIEEQNVDLDQLGIQDRDVVGVQGDHGAALGAWVPRGTSVSVVYYDAQLDNPGTQPPS